MRRAVDRLIDDVFQQHFDKTQTPLKSSDYVCVLLLDDLKLLDASQLGDDFLDLFDCFRCLAVSGKDRPPGLTQSELKAEEDILHLPIRPIGKLRREARDKHVAILGPWACEEHVSNTAQECKDVVLFVLQRDCGEDIWATSFSGRTDIKTNDLIDAVGKVAINQPLVIWNDARFRTEHEQLSNELPTSQDTEA